METRRAVSILQRVGARWLLVTELNPQVVNQRFITELSGENPDTVKGMWDLDWSVQIGAGDLDQWIVIGTQWKNVTRVSPQSISCDMWESVAPAIEKEWDLNRRITMPLYSRKHWAILSDTQISEEVVGQQIVTTAHWPGDEVQQLWAQGKRIQCIYGAPKDWILLAEQTTHLPASQVVQAGPEPDQFDFAFHLSSGYKLIGATFQPISKIYAFLWEVVPSDVVLNQQVHFTPEFPAKQLADLGFKLESR